MNAQGTFSSAIGDPQPPKLLESVRIHLRTRNYSIRTEQAYVDWMRRFIMFHGKRHPQERGAVEVEAFFEPFGRDSAGVGIYAEPGKGGFALSL